MHKPKKTVTFAEGANEKRGQAASKQVASREGSFRVWELPMFLRASNMKGGNRGGGRPRVASNEKKVSLTIRVKPDTKETIKKKGIRVGPMVDKMVEEMQ